MNLLSNGAREELFAHTVNLRYQLASIPIGSTGKRRPSREAMIPESHALQGLFTELVHDHFDHDIGLRDQEVQDYIANVLSEFCEVEQLYKVCNADGRPLNDVGEMLLETDPIYGPAPSFDRERQVR